MPSWPAQLRNHPYHLLELLAAQAVRQLGPPVAARDRWLRARYPRIAAPGLVRLAAREVGGRAPLAGLLAQAGGQLAPLIELGGLGWVRVELVLRVAAAHGYDAADPDRAADLLVLMARYPDRDRAAAGIAAPQQSRTVVSDQRERLRRYAQVLTGPVRARRLARLAGRYAPGAGLVAGALLARNGTERLLHRADRYFAAGRTAGNWASTTTPG